MRGFGIAIAFLAACPVFAQPTFTGSFENERLPEAVKKIEAQLPVHFLFNEPDIDSTVVSGSFSQASLETVLSTVLREKEVFWTQLGKQIVLTAKVQIITEPELKTSFQRQGTTTSGGVEKGLVFSREFAGYGDEDDMEKRVFEIGSRSQMVPGSKSTIAGYIREKGTGDPIAGALVYVQEPFTATSSDESGFYSLTLPNGKQNILFQFVGMKPTSRSVVVFSNGKLNVQMDIDVIALQEVTVVSDRDLNLKNVQMGVNKINLESAKTVPVILGENDVMKVATTLPGVQTLGEGSSGFNVRGGKADQNLVLINQAPVYNASHFFGFFSVFNSDALQNMELFKSGIPAKYGGRLASIFEIQPKEANKDEFHGKGGLSPITSRLTLEIPIIKGKTGLLIGGRSTYSNWVLKNVKNAGFKDNRVSFYDVIAQVDHKIDENNSLTFASYFSRDEFRLSSDTLFSFSDFSYVNANTSLRWKRQVSDRMEGSLAAVVSHYSYELLYDESMPNAFKQDFGITETSLVSDLTYDLGETHRFTGGLSVKNYQINPGRKLPSGSGSIVKPLVIQEEQGLESAFYVSDQFDLSPLISVYGGLRYVLFTAMGGRDEYIYEDGLPKNRDTVIDSVSFGKGEAIKTYHGPEIRLSSRFSLDELTSLKISYNRTRQYIHSMSNSASLSPTDTWRLSGTHIVPQTSDHFSAGVYRNLFGHQLETSIEAYYKKMQNLLDFKIGSTLLLNNQIERDILQGDGKSYGVEFSAKKNGKLNGWINYTYSRTFIRLDGKTAEEQVNGGSYYPASYDKPHTGNLVANYKLTRRISFSVNGTYNTGRPVTVPVAAYDYQGSQNIHYSERNAYRIPDYFRMDLGVFLEGNHKIRKLAHSFWALSIYNITGRDNPYSVFFDVKDGKVSGYQLVVFGSPIPTLSYNFKF